ncbi:DNA-binding response regulator [Vallitalea longa]|uniref:Heme response regulator HssR n=1 Tax=Vallitalea longa TaxID=2936439 RepID=A0A9W5Y951_9FIRM|nr:response regulator transcription factor [Vallitalea longa]GKX28829.1 DNA-binding response regulator [Vallitalea longa]
MFNILVCEDDRNIRQLMCEYLKKENYNVYESSNGEEGLNILDTAHIDLLITDIMMPKLDGILFSKELREAGYELPILMVTAKETIDDKKTGFRAGADDYMVKPIDMDEMLIRVEALLRRAKIASDKRLIVGNTIFDYNSLTVTIGEEVLELPQKEFRLIYKMLSQPNRIFTRQQLMDEIWGYEVDSDHRTIDVHIKRLREKFSDNKDFNLVTIRGLGYKAVKL